MYAFYRSLRAYERALGDSTMVISPDSEFFDYLKTNGLAPPPKTGDGAGTSGEAATDDDRAANTPTAPSGATGGATDDTAAPATTGTDNN